MHKKYKEIPPEISVLPPNSFSTMRDDFNFDEINISFNGCGFLGIYHVGVACALKHYMPDMKYANVCGCSAGAMAAVALLADVPAGKHYKFITQMTS